MITNAPIYVNWNYTYKCNLNCKHCYSRGKEESIVLNTEEYKEIVKRLSKANVFEVNLGGGEPLLRKDCIEIIQEISNQGMNSNLSSNGWYLTNENIKKLKKSNLGTLYISIDHSCAEKHNFVRGNQESFEKAIIGIKNALFQQINTVFSTVVTNINFEDLENIIKLAREIGVKRVDFKRFKTKGNGEDNKDLFTLTKVQEESLYDRVKELKNKYKDIIINLVYNENVYENIDQGCPCGKTALGLTPDGSILPCVYNSFSIGNILKDNLSEIWKENETLKAMRKNLTCMGLME